LTPKSGVNKSHRSDITTCVGTNSNRNDIATENGFSVEEHEVQSSGGFTLKKVECSDRKFRVWVTGLG